MDRKSAERHLVLEFNCALENVEEVKAILLQYIEPARSEDGCLYQNDAVPNRFFILDGWRDQAAFDGHRQHPNVVRGLSAPRLNEPAKLSTNSRIIDAR